MMLPTYRFAPSPNGDLHLGHALSAALNWRMARKVSGRFLVRIEDVDQVRSRPEIARRQLEDLAWLGISSDEPPLFQSERTAAYGAALARLRALGVLYECTRPRSQLSGEAGVRRDPDGAPRVERSNAMPAGPAAIRLDMARAFDLTGPVNWTETGEGSVSADPRAWGDVVLLRRDGGAAYHLAVVVDDAAQAITHVVRGHDLRLQTAVHRMLQVLLGLPAPLAYHHHRLILGPDGRKLSKSEGALSLGAMRARGATPLDIMRLIGLSDPEGPEATA
jgi:glutamyl-Q tRNA(Asp) synthetase